MKILIGSLLFATVILINFSELNSSPQPSSEAGPSHVNLNVENIYPEPRVSKHTYIDLYNQQIEVDLAKINNRYVPVDCRVIHTILSIPTKVTRKRINFMTQADFKKVEENFIRIVIYVEENDRKEKRLLGAKLPPPTGRDLYASGDPRNLNPDHNKWFITYYGVDYVVEVEPVSQTNVDVKLWGHQNIRPNHEEIVKNWHQYPYIHFCGVYILQFVNKNNVVQGAALDPFPMYRPGEELAHLNPYINPHMHRQIDRPTERNLGHQQNLDPSQQYPQQGAHQPPHFESNQNDHYQNYHPNP